MRGTALRSAFGQMQPVPGPCAPHAGHIAAGAGVTDAKNIPRIDWDEVRRMVQSPADALARAAYVRGRQDAERLPDAEVDRLNKARERVLKRRGLPGDWL
jgi:hypothetical protein